MFQTPSCIDADIVPTPLPSSRLAFLTATPPCDHVLLASARVRELETELARRRGLENVASDLAGDVVVNREKYRRVKAQLVAERRRRKAAEAAAAAAKDQCADVKEELNTTLGALRHGRSRETAAASALSGQVGAVDQLRDAVQALRLDKQALQRQNAALELGLQRERSKTEELEASVEAWRDAAARPEVTAHATLKERFAQLEEEAALLRERCAVADRRLQETAAQHAADVSRLEDDVRHRDGVISGLQVDMNALQVLRVGLDDDDGGIGAGDGGGGGGGGSDDDQSGGGGGVQTRALRLQLDSAARQLADQATLLTQLREDNADLRALTHRLTVALEAATDTGSVPSGSVSGGGGGGGGGGGSSLL